MKLDKMHSFGKIIAKNFFNSNSLVKEKTQNLAIKYGFTIVGVTEHVFEPQGYTFVLLLAESHISVHTYPEYDYADVDCFTCGGQDPEQFIKDLATEFLGTVENQKTFNRN